MGVLCADGQGVPQDYIEAYKWTRLATIRASDHNEEGFAPMLDSLAEKMIPAQIAEAEKRAAEWTAAFERRGK